jgi:prefoldin subunit 5
MKELIVKEYMHLNRKRRHLQKRIEKDQAKIAEVEKRINELKPYFEEKLKK